MPVDSTTVTEDEFEGVKGTRHEPYKHGETTAAQRIWESEGAAGSVQEEVEFDDFELIGIDEADYGKENDEGVRKMEVPGVEDIQVLAV